jgi:SAM-dependent methyltransferase
MVTVVHKIKAKGLRGTARAIVDRLEEVLLEWYWERRLGVSTSGRTASEALGCNEHHSFYAPTAYGNVLRILRALDIRPDRRQVLVDVGCGKGRVLVMAARLPFARVVGIDRSPELVAEARRNVEQARRRGADTRVDLVTADAAAYGIPDDATIVYFASPFGGHVLDSVLTQVSVSLARAPRRLRIVSHGYDAGNPFERQIRECEWLRLRTEVPLQRCNCAWIYENSYWTAPRPGMPAA